MIEWISVEDDKPKLAKGHNRWSDEVLVCDCELKTTWYDSYDCRNEFWNEEKHLTHWSPINLPERKE